MSVRLPRCILFDLDGTLLDSAAGIDHSVRAAYVSCNLALPQMTLREMIGPPIRTILSQVGNITDARTLTQLEDAFRANYDSEGWRKTICFPSAKKVLRIMRQRGHRLFVVTNKPRNISLQILEMEGILNLFESIITRDSCLPAYSGKEDMIRLLMRSRRVVPDGCLLVGDTMEDAESAAAVGIRFVYMVHGYGNVTENTRVPIDLRLESFLQFLPLIMEDLVCD